MPASTLDCMAANPHNAGMARMVHCIKLGKEAEGLDRVPVKGPLGERIFEQVSKEAWKQWIAHSTMLVNEYRLELGTPEATRVWLSELEKFFFGTGSAAPEGFVPPTDSAAQPAADATPPEGKRSGDGA